MIRPLANAISPPGHPFRGIVLWTALIASLSGLHVVAQGADSPLFAGITARLFLIPVIYAAVTGGLAQGFSAGLAAALSLSAVMLSHTSHLYGGAWNASYIEHLIEAPFFILFGTLTGLFRDHVRREKSQRERTVDLFSRFVSPSVVKEILQRGAVLEGEETEATVLFADVRGFTTMCEGMAPARVFQLLNAFFGEMVAIVFAERGLLDKYIGDAVMVIFGVPIRSSDHAACAVRTALAMIGRLEELNAKKFFGDVRINIGIGIHTGPLMAGHVGCLERMEYTVMGDTVNVASRLQALTKEYDVPILVSEATRAAITDPSEFKFLEMDPVTVRGRSHLLKIHALGASTGGIAAR
ncbi:MAG: adenylate/guanylate cyclase domain-containing protein [Holophagaceae bacterium]|nr:adenylate/guanylate cyclase domain-containing protein [Holophagaceae bacterium]